MTDADPLSNLASEAKIISELTSRLFDVFRPGLERVEDLGWRHPQEIRHVHLYAVTKLAGAASTLNGAIVLAQNGYWFQVAVLARTVTESLLCIDYVLPRTDQNPADWPTAKQKEAIAVHFQETWANPQQPFADTLQRPAIRGLAAAIGSYQEKTAALTPADAASAALQTMRFLSDYTHVAYPQVMELFDAKDGHALSGPQTGSSYNAEQLGRLIAQFTEHLGAVCMLVIMNLHQVLQMMRDRSVDPGKIRALTVYVEDVDVVLTDTIATCDRLDQIYPTPETDVKTLLKEFRKT